MSSVSDSLDAASRTASTIAPASKSWTRMLWIGVGTDAVRLTRGTALLRRLALRISALQCARRFVNDATGRFECASELRLVDLDVVAGIEHASNGVNDA